MAGCQLANENMRGLIGETLYVSRQIAVDSTGNVVGEGGCEAHSRQVMANIMPVVKAVGGRMDNVVMITCFLTDIANYPANRKVRAETFPSDPPASSTVIVAGLVRPELLVEVEAVGPQPKRGSLQNQGREKRIGFALDLHTHHLPIPIHIAYST
jgi:enamine deaminase RidA (YjgF/YER057c/UK114 family)